MHCLQFMLRLLPLSQKIQLRLRADDLYTEALQLTTDESESLRPVLYRNRALARLRRDDFEGAQSDCNKALKFDGAGVNALFRRALAREQLGNVGPAFNDAKEALRLSPQDKGIVETLQRLVKANNDKIKQTTSLANKVTDMEKLAFRGEARDVAQKQTALNKLLVLCRKSEPGATSVWNQNFIKIETETRKFQEMLQDPKVEVFQRETVIDIFLKTQMQRLEEEMVFDTKRLIFKERVDFLFNALISRCTDDEEGHKYRIKLSCFLITMLQGATSVGNQKIDRSPFKMGGAKQEVSIKDRTDAAGNIDGVS
ncbi:unnamed protein product [Caenorhabditis nigoni]